jgi:uncharacterized protein YbjT (DUF2867 family)
MTTTLIVSGTGKTGRRVAGRLNARGLPIRIGTPSTDPSFDWNDQATWAPALQGVDSVYVAYAPDLGSRGLPKRSGRSPTWRWQAAPGGWCCCRAGARKAPSAASRR